MNDLIARLQDSALAQTVAQDDVLFPMLEALHVLAVCLVVGSIFVVDLRLLGRAWQHRPVSRVTAAILPVTWTAFLVAVLAGGLMFISNAARYLENGYFQAKLVLMALAGVNMLIFHVILARDVALWDDRARPPLPVRL